MDASGRTRALVIRAKRATGTSVPINHSRNGTKISRVGLVGREPLPA